MVDTMVLTCILNRHKVLHLLYNAYRRAVTTLITTYRTYIAIRQIITTTTMTNVVSKTRDALREAIYMFALHLEDVHRKAQCCAAANAW